MRSHIIHSRCHVRLTRANQRIRLLVLYSNFYFSRHRVLPHQLSAGAWIILRERRTWSCSQRLTRQSIPFRAVLDSWASFFHRVQCDLTLSSTRQYFTLSYTVCLLSALGSSLGSDAVLTYFSNFSLRLGRMTHCRVDEVSPLPIVRRSSFSLRLNYCHSSSPISILNRRSTWTQFGRLHGTQP